MTASDHVIGRQSPTSVARTLNKSLENTSAVSSTDRQIYRYSTLQDAFQNISTVDTMSPEPTRLLI